MEEVGLALLTQRVGGLGFLRLKEFNTALLAKQGWRFLSNPTSLASRLFKARYFPKETFLSASLGANLSYVWRSLLESQGLLRQGCHIVFGPGQIELLELQRLYDSPVPSTLSDHMSSLRVRNFFMNGKRNWNRDLIKACFYWREEFFGEFSVKSAYRLLLRTTGVWSQQHHRDCWKKVWSIGVPPRVSFFLWRCLSGCLPTRTCLARRGVLLVTSCPFCGLDEESETHLFISCPTLYTVRASISLGSGNEESLVNHFMSICDSRNEENVSKIIILWWWIWKAMNDLVWRNKRMTIETIIIMAEKSRGEWVASHPLNIRSAQVANHHRWRAPEAGWQKINTDGAVLPIGDCAGLGMIIRDDAGRCLGAKCINIQEALDPIKVEALALLHGVKWARERNCRNTIFEMDFQQLGNCAAHLLATAVRRGSDQEFLLDMLPVELCNAIYVDSASV